jgi:hypothetical protein
MQSVENAMPPNAAGAAPSSIVFGKYRFWSSLRKKTKSSRVTR